MLNTHRPSGWQHRWWARDEQPFQDVNSGRQESHLCYNIVQVALPLIIMTIAMIMMQKINFGPILGHLIGLFFSKVGPFGPSGSPRTAIRGHIWSQLPILGLFGGPGGPKRGPSMPNNSLVSYCDDYDHDIHNYTFQWFGGIVSLFQASCSRRLPSLLLHRRPRLPLHCSWPLAASS